MDKAPVDVLFKDDSYSYNLDDPDPANLPINQFLALYVDYCTENLYELFPKKHDAQVAFLGIPPHAVSIETLEGTMKATFEDWIIKGVKGELYPCKPDIFEATYEVVEEQ